MKYVFVFFLFVTLSSSLYAQKEIKTTEAANHVGDSVTMTGEIMGARFLTGSNGRPTLMNMGAPYPNQHLTLIILGENRSQFSGAPEMLYNNTMVRVWGKVELFKGKPQIVLKSEKQIQVLADPSEDSDIEN